MTRSKKIGFQNSLEMNNRKCKSDVPVHLIVIINQSKLDMMDITKFECKLLLMQLLPSATSVASVACIKILLLKILLVLLKSQRSLKKVSKKSLKIF